MSIRIAILDPLNSNTVDKVKNISELDSKLMSQNKG